MTCQVKVEAPDGSSVKVRALLDSGSTSSFVSEHLVQSLSLSRRSQRLTVPGIGGTSHISPLSSLSTFEISSLCTPRAKFAITAIVVPRVTCDLPLQPVRNHSDWDHLSNITLADPDFATPEKIDLLLEADVMYCCTAGGVDPTTLQPHLKRNSDGFSPGEQIALAQAVTAIMPSPLTTQPSSLVTSSYANSGKRRKTPNIRPISRPKSVPLFATLNSITHVQKLAVLLLRYLRTHEVNRLESPGLKPSGDSLLWNDLSTPKGNFKNFQT